MIKKEKAGKKPKKEEKEIDFSEDRTFKILKRECAKKGYACKLSKTGLFVADGSDGLGASAALDSFHLHLFKKGPMVKGLATFLGKDMGLTGVDRSKKMHEEIDDLSDPPTDIPPKLKAISKLIAGLLTKIEDSELASDDDDSD